MPKGYWKASGQFLKGIGKPLEKCPNTCCQPIGEEAALPGGYCQKHGNSHPFSLKLLGFCLHLLKVAEAVENFKNAQQFFSYFWSFQPHNF
jgi:hypothetical protein